MQKSLKVLPFFGSLVQALFGPYFTFVDHRGEQKTNMGKEKGKTPPPKHVPMPGTSLPWPALAPPYRGKDDTALWALCMGSPQWKIGTKIGPKIGTNNTLVF